MNIYPNPDVSPEYYILRAYDFSVYGNLDFSSERTRANRAEWNRVKLLRHLIVETSKQTGIHNRCFEYFSVEESSEAGERHIHFILKRHPTIDANIDSVVRIFRSIWRDQWQAGQGKFEPFDNSRRLKCFSYLTKLQPEFDACGCTNPDKKPFFTRGFAKRITQDIDKGEVWPDFRNN